jgi:MFS family permease
VVGLANSFATVVAFRALGGLFSAGGSITLGIVADMYTADTQQYAVAFTALASVGGSIFGPIIGGFVESFMGNWRWCIWLQLIAGAVVQAMHFFLVAETRSTTLLDKHAKLLRKTGANTNAYGPNEHKTWRQLLAPKEMLAIWWRPFHMFLTEPIVSILSLLSGFVSYYDSWLALLVEQKPHSSPFILEDIVANSLPYRAMRLFLWGFNLLVLSMSCGTSNHGRLA